MDFLFALAWDYFYRSDFFVRAAGLLVAQPFDTVKVRLQAQTSQRVRYSGAFDCFTSVIRQETVRGLYKGLASLLIGNCLINTILFGFHGNLLKQFNNPGYIEVFWCGAAAGVVQSVVSCPIELAKIRAQMEGIGKVPSGRDHGSIKAFTNIYKMEGIVGCYRGMASTVIRDLGFGFYFVCYEYICNELTKLTRDKRKNMLVSIASGGLTGIASWVVVFPMDVIKTRIQMDGANGPLQYNGIVDAFRKSIRQDGWQVMTRGFGTTAVRSIPCNAVIFPVVEIMLKILK